MVIQVDTIDPIWRRKKEFALREVAFGPQQMRTLKLIDQDNLYSNLGLLLSDQCVHTIKSAGPPWLFL